MDERGLIQGCLKQDKAAWDEFVDRYSRLIYNYIHSVYKIKGVGCRPDTVNELFQEIFLSLIKDNFHKLRQFKGKNNASLASWLRVITINFCLNYLKRDNKSKPSSLDEDLGEGEFSLKDMLSDQHILADEHLTDQERLEYLFECIDILNNQDRYFLEMHIYQDVKLEDLQVVLGVSRSAMDMRKSRVVQKLRNCFQDKGFLLDS